MVDSFEDDWEGLEPDVEQSIYKGYVHIEEEDDWFAEVEGDGADERDEDDLWVQMGLVRPLSRGVLEMETYILSCHVLSHDFWLTSQALDARQFLNRRVRRYKIFVELVSGRKKINSIRENPESHISSQIVQVQPLA